MDDGNICAVVVEVNDKYLDIKITHTRKNGEHIKPYKGVNFPASLVYLNVPAITDRDIQLLLKIIPFVDIVGISFISTYVETVTLLELKKQLKPLRMPI